MTTKNVTEELARCLRYARCDECLGRADDKPCCLAWHIEANEVLLALDMIRLARRMSKPRRLRRRR